MRIRLLGDFDVDGVPVHEIGSRKARTLLKALAAARGQPVSVDALTDILWPGALPARPAEQIQVLVSRLRATFGTDRITRTDAGYSLHYDWLDIDELDTRAAEAQSRLAAGSTGAARAAAAAALHLAGGPLLPDEEGDWVEHARRAVERTVSRARSVGAEAALIAGDGTGAAELAEAALEHDPYDERALRTLMAAHVTAGRPASALAAYARCRERLAEELGVSPASETEDLHTAILRGEFVPPQADRAAVVEQHALGGGGGPALAGRADALAALDRHFVDVVAGASRVVVVRGEAGIGKTALVSSWSRTVTGTALVLFARCDELGQELPLQPVLDALTDHVRALPDADATAIVGPDVAVLGPLVGVIAPPPLRQDEAFTPGDPAAGQARLFAALVDVIRRAAGGRPVVLIVDDVHLGSSSTASWIGFAVRRMPHLLVVTTRRTDALAAPSEPALGASTIELAPLDVDAVAEIVGADRALALHRRSGGNPLFLVELAASPGGELPGTIIDAIRRRADVLGNAAGTIRTAALLGSEVDIDVLAACTDRPLGAVLDDLEAAARCRLLVERGQGFVFAHDLIREALAADVTAARRAVVHREAAAALSRRADERPLRTAFHAQLGGATTEAAAALVDAARLAAERFDADAAEQLLDQAIALADSAQARLVRARVRMARSDHAGAAIDVSYAIGPNAGADVFELAGWIAYYRRDYVVASRYADEAVRRADGGALRSSALALAGRIRHSRGQLRDASAHLEEAVRLAPSPGGGIADVWLASLRAHQGRLADALALGDRIEHAESFPHPFAVLHVRFARCLALGLSGRLGGAADALAALERAVERLGSQGRRFAPVAANMAAWLLRSTGREEEADERNAAAVELSHGTAFDEPRAHARLDLAEGRRRAGDLAAAGALVEDVAAAHDVDGTMAWHVRQRTLWMRGRIALDAGDRAHAAAIAADLVADADARGSARYAALGRHLAALSEPASRAATELDALVAAIDAQAGNDAWWLVAELVSAAGGDGLAAGRSRAAELLASTGRDVDREAMGRWIDRRLTRAAGSRQRVS